MILAACGCRVGGRYCHLTAGESRSDFPIVGHEGRQGFSVFIRFFIAVKDFKHMHAGIMKRAIFLS